jgi:G:T-mismatch repair DNA endonuclease (very short patch repair protein)
MVCSVKDCNGKNMAKGFCNKHYLKWYKYGDPLGLSPDEHFKRRSVGQRKRIFTPENLKNIAEANRKRTPHENSINALRKHNIAIRGIPMKSSTKEKMIISLKKKWKEPEHQRKMKLIREKFNADPKVRAKISKSVKKLWEDPEYSENQVNKMIQFYIDNPEARVKASERRAKIKIPFRDSKPELLTQSILKEHNITFKKHKNFKLSDSNHQADIVVEPYHVIEVFGDYWHCHPKKYDADEPRKFKGKFVKVKDIWIYDKYIIDGMKEYGYKVLVVWESELKGDLEKTTKKILRFLKSV